MLCKSLPWLLSFCTSSGHHQSTAWHLAFSCPCTTLNSSFLKLQRALGMKDQEAGPSQPLPTTGTQELTQLQVNEQKQVCRSRQLLEQRGHSWGRSEAPARGTGLWTLLKWNTARHLERTRTISGGNYPRHPRTKSKFPNSTHRKSHLPKKDKRKSTCMFLRIQQVPEEPEGYPCHRTAASM